MFYHDFLWGVATASYQIEGAYLEDGKSLSIWDTFTHQKGNTYRNQNADIACDHYHRYEEDVRLMKELGVDVYRFSISWSRILPNGIGLVNEKGIAFYSHLIDLLLKHNIRPFVTLYHWDMPQCLEDQGGFLNPDFPKWFEEYTCVVCQYLGDRVHDYITINEPENCIYNGLGIGLMAPGKIVSIKDRLLAIHHILLAHGRAVKVIRNQDEKANIGFSACGWVPVPHPVNEENLKASYHQYFALDKERLGDGVAIWYDPIFLGKYPIEYEALYHDEMPKITKEDMELISQKIDFCGVNLYSGYYVKKENGTLMIENPTDRKTMDNGWVILEEVMYYSAKFLYERYQKPIIITESGCADYAKPNNGRVSDQMRINCLHSYLSWLEKAYLEGVDIRGYFHWSLLDNFEWERGYQPRFGLIYTDYAHHQKRIKKDSFYAYQAIIEESKRG